MSLQASLQRYHGSDPSEGFTPSWADLIMSFISPKPNRWNMYAYMDVFMHAMAFQVINF